MKDEIKNQKVKNTEEEEVFNPFKCEEDFKQAFPSLRNLNGRFLNLKLLWLDEKTKRFMNYLNKTCLEFASFAEEQIGNKKCYDDYTDDIICRICKHLKVHNKEDGYYCEKYPDMGQTWDFYTKKDPANLINSQRIDIRWYWCIKECVDFRRVDSK